MQIALELLSGDKFAMQSDSTDRRDDLPAPWDRFNGFVGRYIPKARVSYPWPEARFRVKHFEVGAPVRGQRSPGSVRGAVSKDRPYRDWSESRSTCFTSRDLCYDSSEGTLLVSLSSGHLIIYNSRTDDMDRIPNPNQTEQAIDEIEDLVRSDEELRPEVKDMIIAHVQHQASQIREDWVEELGLRTALFCQAMRSIADERHDPVLMDEIRQALSRKFRAAPGGIYLL